MKFITVGKINVAFDREEEFLSQISDKFTDAFFRVGIDSRSKVD